MKLVMNDDEERLKLTARLGLPETAADAEVATAMSEFLKSDGVAAEMAVGARRRGVLGQVVQGTANVDDLRRAFYDNIAALGLPEWTWLRAVYLDPNEVIADDDDGTLYRLPYEVDGDTFVFGTPAKVKVEYVVAASGGIGIQPLKFNEGRTVVASFDTKEASRPLAQPSRPAKRPAAAPTRAVPRAADCEEAIAAAIVDDKIPASRANHYRHRWSRDPVGTAKLIARMVSVTGLNVMAEEDAADSRYPADWLQHADRARNRSRVHHGGD
jgi:hypothetical protein